MPTTPKHALPYPASTDAVNQGAVNFQNLATKLDTENMIPAGGTAGQYLAKSSGVDFAAGWVSLGGGFVPAAGAVGQYLAKTGSGDFATGWTSFGGGFVPAGGAAGQVLSKASGADFATVWSTVTGGGGPSPVAATGTVSSAGAILAGTGFTVARTGTGRYTVTFPVALAAAPTVLAVSQNPSPGVAGSLAGAVSVNALSASAFGIETWNTGFTLADRQFSFVAFVTV